MQVLHSIDETQQVQNGHNFSVFHMLSQTISSKNDTDWYFGVKQFWQYTAPMYTSSTHQKICGLILSSVPLRYRGYGYSSLQLSGKF